MSQPAQDVSECINRRMRQFLIHSFSYYKLDQTMISDHAYDFLCQDLTKLMTEFPEISKSNPYYGLCQGIENNGSGFYITQYPNELITTAFRLLWLDKKQKNPHFVENFEQFLGRWGYQLEG